MAYLSNFAQLSKQQSYFFKSSLVSIDYEVLNESPVCDSFKSCFPSFSLEVFILSFKLISKDYCFINSVSVIADFPPLLVICHQHTFCSVLFMIFVICHIETPVHIPGLFILSLILICLYGPLKNLEAGHGGACL